MSDPITTLIDARLKNSLGSAFANQNNITITNTVINSIIPSISKGVAKDTTSIVNKEANYQLNEIPNNLIGKHNPVNLVSNNLNPNSLNNTLKNNIGNQVNLDVTNNLVRKVDEVLRLNIPGGGNNPTLINLKTNILNIIQNDVNKIVNLALNGFSNGVFNKGVTVLLS